MKTIYSTQYETRCLVPDEGEHDADDIIERCRSIGAVFYEDGPDDECFVVTLRRDVGPGLWSESALRRTFKSREQG